MINNEGIKMTINRIKFNAEEEIKKYMKERKESFKKTTTELKEEYSGYSNNITKMQQDMNEVFIRVFLGEKKVDINGDDYKIVGYHISGQDTIRIDIRRL